MRAMLRKRLTLQRAAWQAEKRRLDELRQVAVAKGGLSDARDEFEAQARSMADKLALRERDLKRQEQGIVEGQKRSKQQDVDTKNKASKIIQDAQRQERQILAEAESRAEQRLEQRQQALEKRENDLGRRTRELTEIHQNAVREAAKLAVEVITAVFFGQSGVNKNGDLFVAQPKLAERIKELQIGSVLKEAVQMLSDYWGGLKDRLSPHQVAKERDEAKRLAKAIKDAPDNNGGPAP